MLKYFSKNFLELKQTNDIVGLKQSYKIAVGDVIKIFYAIKGSNFYFEGFCFYLKQKAYLLPDTGIMLIAKIKGYIVTFSFSFFYNLIFFNEKIDYKKTKSIYRASSITKFKNLVLN